MMLLLCLSHYIHFLLQQQPTQKPRTLAIYCRKWLFLTLSLRPRPIVPAAAQPQGRYIQSEPGRAGAALLEESHCFNYSHVITPINCHVFVNAQEEKKETKGNKKDGKAEIASGVISPGDKLAALISVLTEAPAGGRPAVQQGQLVIPAQRGLEGGKCGAYGLSGADLAAARTRASAANPLYSAINPHSCAHLVRALV